MNAISKRDKNLCREISSSIGNLVRYSFNEEFRRKCYAVIKVDNTRDLEKEVDRKLKKVCEGKCLKFNIKEQLSQNTKDYRCQLVENQILRETPITVEQMTPSKGTKNWLAVAVKQAKLTKSKPSVVPYPYNKRQPLSKLNRNNEEYCSQVSNSSQSVWEFSPRVLQTSDGRTNFMLTVDRDFESTDHVRRALFQ